MAPGRVNMLGEHTDYNDGFVLPATIPRYTHVELARSRDGFFHLYSENLSDAAALVSYPDGGRAPEGYARYVDGCVQVLRQQGATVPACSMLIQSDVPMGSGLSSSAALEVAVLRGLRELCRIELNDIALAQLAQQAEIEYAGVRCGIMDQMAASVGQADHLLFLDTRSLDSHLLPFPHATEIVVLDSGVARTLASSGYNARRAECERAAELLEVRALRDIDDTDVTQKLPAPLDRRVRHVVTENRRVLAAAQGVGAREFGKLMNESHVSLRDDYEVSIPPLDTLVESLQACPGVFGARLTGAGFGGACVALCAAGTRFAVQQRALSRYAAAGYRGVALV